MRYKKHDRKAIMAYVRQHAGEKTALDMAVELDVDRSYIVNCGHVMGISLALKCNVEKIKLISDLVTEYSSEKTVYEIAKMADVSVSRIRYFGYQNDIEFKRELAKQVNRKNRTGKEGFFNEFERENWLV